MKRPTAPELVRLRQRIQQLDEASIDHLYGLEPIWEPAAGVRRRARGVRRGGLPVLR